MPPPRGSRSRNATRPGNGHVFNFNDDKASCSRVLCRMSGSLPTQAPLHFPTWYAKHEPAPSSKPITLRQSWRARNVALRLAGILLGTKDAEALHEVREIHAV